MSAPNAEGDSPGDTCAACACAGVSASEAFAMGLVSGIAIGPASIGRLRVILCAQHRVAAAAMADVLKRLNDAKVAT